MGVKGASCCDPKGLLRWAWPSDPSTLCLSACHCHRYNMQLEFGRAVQAVGMNAILRQHLLPQLASMAAVGAEAEAGSGDASSALWLHYADAAMRFEKR